MITRVISGGQTGADQAALRAAKTAGIPTGGWAPKGWLTEDGPAPWLAEYGLVEHQSAEYPPRTKDNVALARACMWFGDSASPGGRLTIRLCRQEVMPLFIAGTVQVDPRMVADWVLRYVDGPTLVAGNRESKMPGIGEWTERFLADVFGQLAKLRAVSSDR